MSPLQLFLFGAPRLARGDGQDAGALPVRRRKSLALLAYLAVSKQAHNRDTLATLLWPDSDQSAARANLRRDLSRLQHDLGAEIVQAEQDLIALRAEALWCDVNAFRQKMARVAGHDHAGAGGEPGDALCDECAQLLQEAVAYYRGDFMSGFRVAESAAFEEWQLFQAERLRRKYGSALQQLLQWHAGRGETEQALAYGGRWLELDPLHEGAQRQMMRLFAWSGQRAAALRQYEACVRILQDELGVSPAPETVALYEEIRTQSLPEPRAAGSKTGAATAPVQEQRAPEARATPGALQIPFVGRNQELERLTAALAQVARGRGQTVLLEGEPGIGKSRLVQEAARIGAQQGVGLLLGKCYQGEESVPYQVVITLLEQILATLPDEALKRLSPATLAELALLAPEISARFPDLPPARGLEEARQARLFRSISQLLLALAAANKGLMVVIDDLQWADPVTRLLAINLAHQTAREAILLVLTYRSESVATDEELATHVQLLLNQAGVQHLVLQRLSSEDAASMVLQLPAAAAEAGVLGQWLHRETDGNPFFLVSILQSLQEEGLLTRQHAGRWRLDGERLAQGEARLALPEALQEAIRARLLRLPRAQRAVLETAAIYGRSFSFNTLQAITGESALSLLDLLENLMQRQLLLEEDDGRLYDFSHDKIREVVYQDLSAARRKLLHRVVGETLEERGQETAALLAGHYEAAQLWDKAAAQLQAAAADARELFAVREALGFYDRALQAVIHAEQAGEARLPALYEARGETRALAGDFEGAAYDLQHALGLARAGNAPDKERALLTQLGMTYRRADDYENARSTLDHALALARAAGDAHSIADNLFHLGTVIWTEGDNRRSAPYQEEAVAICRRHGFGDLVAVQATHGRAENFFLSGFYEEAVAYFSESLALARQIGDRGYEAENLYMLGAVHSGLIGADYEQAKAALEESLRISRAAQMGWHIVPPLFLLCNVVASLGDYGAALRYGLEAVQLAEQLGIVYFKSMALDFLGNLYRGLNLLDEAEEAHAQGVAAAARGQAGNWLPRIEADLAMDRLRQGQLDVGDTLKASLALCVARNQELHAARCLEGLAEWALAAGDPAQALLYAQQLEELARPRGMREALVTALQWQGVAQTRLGEPAQAQETLAGALQLAETLAVQCVLREVHGAMLSFHRHAGNPAQAAQHGAALETIIARIVETLPDAALRRGLKTAGSYA